MRSFDCSLDGKYKIIEIIGCELIKKNLILCLKKKLENISAKFYLLDEEKFTKLLVTKGSQKCDYNYFFKKNIWLYISEKQSRKNIL